MKPNTIFEITPLKNMNVKSILLMLGASMLLLGCEHKVEEVEQDVRTVNVETEVIEKQQFESFLRQVGTVVTSADVNVSAEVNGRITEVMKREGMPVRAGETVIKIDDRRLQQEVRRLRAATEQSRENYDRLKRLYDEENIGSEIDVLNSQYTYEQNASALESMRIDLENTLIKAPFNGVLEELFSEKGEMVTPGVPVFRLVSSINKKIRLGVPARFSEVVDRGDEAEIWFDFDPSKRYMLPISFIGNTIDPRNRTFRVEIELPADFDRVKIDMIANVRLRTEQFDDVIVVGEEFVFTKNGSSVVYTVDRNSSGDELAVENIVKTGSSFANRTVIHEGLNEGELLITLGASYLNDGSRIRLIEKRSTGNSSNPERE